MTRAGAARRAAPGPAVLAAALLLLLAAGTARAERADRDKDAAFSADHATLDDLHQVEVLTGHVLLTKGTMRLTGERMEHRQDEHGYQYYVVEAAPGELATFHERRDPVLPGVESTLDGVGERIEYDDKSDQVVLLRRAVVKRYDNGEQRDVISGERIVYDGRKASYEVEGRSGDGGPRVSGTFPPRNGAAPPGAAPPSGLQPDRTPPAARP